MRTTEENNKKIRIRRGIIFLLSAILAIFVFIFTPKEKITEIKKKPTVLAPMRVVNDSTDFRTNTFTDGEEYKILAELGICDTTLVKDEVGACSPKYFRFFPLNHKKKLSQSCIILINGKAFNDPGVKFPIRRTLVFEKENGRWVSVNKFKGYFIQRRSVANSDYDDLVMRFRRDKFNEAYHVVYSWKNGRYEFSYCEEFFTYNNQGKVRKEMIDSISREVKKILVKERLAF